MPTFEHGKLTGVAFEDHDVTPYLNEFTGTVEVETGDTTTFDKTARTFIVGLENATYSLSGLWSGSDSTVEIDEILDGAIAVEDGAHVLLQQGYQVGQAPGVRTYFGRGDLTSYEISSPVGDVVSLSAEVQGDRGLLHGVILHDPDASTNPGFQEVAFGQTANNASVDNGGSTSDGYTAQLHVVSNDLNGATTITVEDSPDDAAWSTVDTFSSVNASETTVEQIFGTGTVDQYVRITIDTTAAGTGSIILAVGFSRSAK